MNSVAMATVATALPTRREAWVFACKAWGLRVLRALRDAADAQRPRRHARAQSLAHAPVLAEFESPLWPRDEADPLLVAGKLQNLRLALKRLDGIEVAAGARFGFWKQVGRATRRRGYAVGRELREGCLIPAVGGGLCQLSNALYDGAVRAGLTVLERHRHSRVLPGSLAEQDRDATVFWNYLDLRFSAPFAWRLEAEMDAQRLRLRIRGHRDAAAQAWPMAVAPRRPPTPGNDCGSCGQHECHRHTGASGGGLRRLWWMEEAWPEFRAALAEQRSEDDRVFGPGGRRFPAQAPWRRVTQSLAWRYGRWRGQALPQVRLAQQRAHARDLARQLRPQDLDLVLPQSLLPFLWREGELAGRRYAVLMTALPMRALQDELDAAVRRHPQVRSLRDFRADPALIDDEWQALQAAESWWSPHAQLLALAGARARALPWALPEAVPAAERIAAGARARVFFPASPLARKGILELLQALHGEDVEILLPPGDSERALDAGRATLRRVVSYRLGLLEADAVVLPAWVEHQPRALLGAIAAGMPVVATPACGLPDSLPWTPVAAGDVAGLRAAVLAALQQRSQPVIPA
ncbi:VanW family protein [Lysobacter silvisoli]|uniref:Vanw family protein n=1 Tax=Lysobacter silvisoli TaxID=2293254 RepID=A0A371K103_9GAMM|nr:VanW family protein [Lysobacter silvisoli]RDZ27527.1 vanw family protein [Lysobacter silvisoli]